MAEVDNMPDRSQTGGTIDSLIGHYSDPTTPGLRDEIQKTAPEQIGSFDAFAAIKNEEINYLRTLLDETSSELRRERARSASSKSNKSSSLGHDDSRSSASFEKSSSSSNSSHGNVPMAKLATRRMQLSSSSGSGSSQQAAGIPMARVATSRMPLSVSSGSYRSQQNAEIPMAKVANRRMLLSSFSGSDGSVRAPIGKLGVHRAPPTVSGETVLSRSPTSATSITPLELSTKQVLLDIDVKLRLVPAIYTLTKLEVSDGSRVGARKVVHDTLNFVRECNGSDALIARCSFYIGVSFYVPGNAASIKEAVNWFQRAKDARLGCYAEGEWAQQWLNYHKSKNMSQMPNRSASVVSWVSEKIGALWGLGRSGASGYSFDSKALPKVTGLRSDDDNISPTGSDKHPAQGEQIPSFTTMGSGDSYASKSGSLQESSTQDHYGLQWSPNSRFGKNEIVSSPASIFGIPESEEPEQDVPYNVMGGFVEAGSLAARSPTSSSSRRKSYIPVGVDPPSPARVLRVRNIASPLPSPLSPHSGSTNMSSYFSDFSGVHAIPSSNGSRPSTISSSQSDPLSETRSHKRQKSVTFDPTVSYDPAISPTQEVPVEIEPANPVAGLQQPQRKRRMGSLSMITTGITTSIATGLEVAGALPHRRRSELAQQMEEGESPGFAPKPSEVAMYRRRNSDIIEEV